MTGSLQSWNYSPEWYGTQGGGWGRDAGVTVFSAQSRCGNGHVTVTAHPASYKGLSSASASSGTRTSSPSSSSSSASSGSEDPTWQWDEWRVLRFNGITRQSVNRVMVTRPVLPADAATTAGAAAEEGGTQEQQQQPPQAVKQGTVVVQPACLAQEYLKTVAAATAALLGLQRLLPAGRDAAATTSSSRPGSALSSSRISSGSSSDGQHGSPGCLRALFIGVGGGTFPLFMAHHFPFAGGRAAFCAAAVP